MEVVSHNRRSALYKYMQSEIQMKIETIVSSFIQLLFVVVPMRGFSIVFTPIKWRPQIFPLAYGN